MKRFLSMLAMAVLVLQGVVTSLVYAVEPEQTNSEEPVSESVVETTIDEADADESSNEAVTKDLTDTETSVVEELTTDIVVNPETPAVEEQVIINEEPEVDFHLPRFNLFKSPESPILIKALNTKSPRGVCEGEDNNSICIKNPVNTAGSLDNEGDVQITKVVETTDIEGEYKITIEVKGNPVETVEATPNNICSIVVFDRSGSMGDEEDVCVETYSEGDCMEHFLRWCTRYAEGGECKRYESQSKKWNDAVNGAKVFASTLNELNNDGDIAKIGLVTFAKDVHIGRTPAFSDLSDGIFGKANGGTNLDAGLLRAQELLDADEFCNTGNAKKYIVAITDGAPTFAGISGDIGNGTNSSILTVTPQTTADAEAIKESGIDIFTIGYQLEEINGFNTADYLKNNIASSPDYAYEGEDADKVAEAFQKISETIKKHAAGTEANLEDKIGGNVTIVTSEENLEPNKLENFTITEDGQIIEFYVKIKDGAKNGDYDTNAGVILTYTGYNPETGDPIPGQELNIETSSQVHWVQPGCEGDRPVVVEGVTKMGAPTYPRKRNDAGNALEPVGYSEWTYVDVKPDLAACEWTCDGEGYVRKGNTCELEKYAVTVDPNCEGEDCNSVTTGDVEHGTKITLPALERKYTLTYQENEKVEPKLESVDVQAELLGYCKNTKECTDKIPAGTEVEITENVTYYAMWNESPLTVEVDKGGNYQDAEHVYTFNTWKDGDNDVAPQSRLTLTANKELVANYIESARSYMVTFVNEDGTVLQSENVAYGEIPEYTGETPTKEGNIEYVYTFDKWTPELTGVTESAVYTATYLESCNTGYHYETNSEGTAADKICVNDEKKEGVVCTQEGAPSNAHYNVTTGAGTWNGTTYVGVKCEWDCNPGYTRNGNSCKSNGGGGGGGGGGGSSSYSCKNLPSNAVANNAKKPNYNTDYSYSADTSKVCTFQCKSGYTRNEEEKKCETSGGNSGGGGDEEEIELGGQVSDKCSIEGSDRSDEEKEAYLYACENDITTIRDINEARLGDYLTRAEMAKMISVFATKELGMKPNTSKDCSNFVNSIADYNQEMKDYMVMACQLEIMGIHTTNYEAIPDFMPNKRVSRAEFGTVLSRILWGNKYEGTNSNYYINHLNALKENNIITNINPHITEYRAWVFLMLYRSVEAIKLAKTTTNETVEEQVNEELQEEGKAETGLVTEYDSGTVVPEMATETESGTLVTGAVDSGSTVENQAGNTVALTNEETSKEVSTETGSIETED